MCACSVTHIWLFVTPWTVPCQAPLSMEFSRQEYWNGLPFPTPGDFPDLGMKPAPLASPTLAGRFFTIVPPRRPSRKECILSHFSHVRLFVTLWIVARQTSLSKGFSSQWYCCGFLRPPLGNLPNPGIEPVSLWSLALAGRFFTTSAT